MTPQFGLRIAGGQCHGHGLCYSRYPELFRYDDEGYAVVCRDVVDGEDAARAAEAAMACPEQAILLEQTPSVGSFP